MEPDGSLFCRESSVFFPNRSQTNPVHTIPSYSLRSILGSSHTQVFKAASFLQGFPPKPWMPFYLYRTQTSNRKLLIHFFSRLSAVLFYLRLDRGCYCADTEEQNKNNYTCHYMTTFHKRLDCRRSKSTFMLIRLSLFVAVDSKILSCFASWTFKALW
jgi:hypothetical protein